MTMEGTGATKPDAGVIATNPATAPEAMPRALGLPLTIHSLNIQASAAAPAAKRVTVLDLPDSPSAATAEPALNPTQPTHSSDAPIIVSVRLWGAIASFPYPTR